MTVKRFAPKPAHLLASTTPGFPKALPTKLNHPANFMDHRVSDANQGVSMLLRGVIFKTVHHSHVKGMTQIAKVEYVVLHLAEGFVWRAKFFRFMLGHIDTLTV
ncbi:hypothetical protein [Sulfitobacter sp. S190]|uniref:hypothetical protein n=1 Tax=Sulfitobacter sp. S190 TaxID=2867022 RepID=UPI0021A8E30B|nr:hypothetical protein [Sulfitobacter sp. S190]UWR22632.1 hypothetical protein K3756_01145 [Sulfitobacter sp. S190]